ncbi:hypothetical protein D5086_023774 [Populus alba]|uniref:Uncharacterized protein n=1 Tax=Populus alba TaxID=43335 RepID=A0ACC4BCL1_POPAL
MALQIHPSLSSSLFKKPSHRLLLLPLRKRTKLKIKAKNPTSNPTAPNKKPTAVSPGRGFGSQSSTAATSSKTSGSWSKKKRKRNRRGRASIAWRTPVEKPGFTRQEYEATFKEMSRNENAFILAWLGLGGIILVEDLVCLLLQPAMTLAVRLRGLGITRYQKMLEI